MIDGINKTGGPAMPHELKANSHATGFDVALAGVTAYWQKMRHGADVPRRSDIDPRGIEGVLANAFVAERIAPGLARMRIAGSHLTDLLGMEVRGMPISAFISPAHRDTLSEGLVRVFDQPATLRLSLLAPGGAGAPALRGTMLLLPLRSDLGDISRVLGCLVTTGMIGRGPRRFDVQRCDVTALGAAPATGFAEARANIEPPATAHPAERPYLRLVRS